ncbi:glycosyltransferase family 2 protein [Micromonospora sp. R77]|nr:glycosyltransferase family 2 protein [Micromonospora sp. R77]
MTTDVTIVVATRNRRDQLLDLLPRHTAPVIVVDNGSDDGTPAAVAAAFPRVRVVALGRNAGAGAARNVGVALADTPFVAFADDDSYWAPGSLERAGELLRRHPRTALLTGQVRVGRQARLDPVSAGMAQAPIGTAPDAPGRACWASWPARWCCAGRRTGRSAGSPSGSARTARRRCWRWNWPRRAGTSRTRRSWWPPPAGAGRPGPRGPAPGRGAQPAAHRGAAPAGGRGAGGGRRGVARPGRPGRRARRGPPGRLGAAPPAAAPGRRGGRPDHAVPAAAERRRARPRRRRRARLTRHAADTWATVPSRAGPGRIDPCPPAAGCSPTSSVRTSSTPTTNRCCWWRRRSGSGSAGCTGRRPT